MTSLYRLISSAAALLFTHALMAQFVTGTVTDPAGPVPGVIVKDITSGAGTATDIDGTFSLKLDAGKHTIEFLMTGYTKVTKTVEVPASGSVKLEVLIQEDLKDLEEVVVVGYGVQRKRELTGAISKIDGKAVTAFPVPSFEAALQGQAAGVQVSQGSGLAGSGSLVRIRGVASISAGGDPLYVVDGIPITQDPFLRGNSGAMNNNPLATLNPNDIASIEVLKDAAATGIYGSRGANGVILITTKRGSNQGIKFDFSSRFGVGVAATLPNMMSTDQYLAIRQEAWENDGGTGYVWLPGFTSATSSAADRETAFLQAQKTNTDWVKETTGIGLKQAYSFSASQKTAKGSFYAGVGYDDNGSYLKGNAFKRTSARINFDRNFGKYFKLVTGASYSNGVNDRIDAAWSGGLGDAMSTALPYYPVTNPDGSYYMWNGGYTNPSAYRENRPWQYVEDRVLANAAVIFTPIKDLNFKISGSYDWLNGNDYRFEPRGLNIGTNDNFSRWGSNRVNNYNYNATVDYFKEIGEDHTITALVGYEEQRGRNFSRYVEYGNASGMANEGGLVAADGTGNARLIGGNPNWIPGGEFKFLSAFSRLNYSYKKKLFVQVSGRMDGSSKFGSNNRTGFFPSVSGGYVLSEEKFLKDSKVISFMKLRAGWGIVGNSDISQNAQYGDRTPGGISYVNQPILFSTKLPNPSLQWEVSSTMDAALDMGFFKDRISVEIGVYRKYTSKAIMDVSIPASSGFGSFTDNTAEILNRGIELTITSFNISKKNFEWKTSFNVSRNYNELVSIGDYTPDAVSGGTNDSRVIVGKPIGSFYLMQWSHVDPATGRPVYLDKNGNETFEYSNFQRQFVGTGLPKAWGGITNSFRYKSFDCSIFATFSLGARIFDSSGKRQMGVVTDWNMRTDILDRWRQPGDQTTFPRLTLDETNYSLPSGFPWWNTSLFVYRADYLRMKNISVGYNIPRKQGSKITALRLGFNVTNLFTITNFPGLDPEIVRDFENPADRNLSPNVTYLTPPQERSYNFSINATF